MSFEILAEQLGAHTQMPELYLRGKTGNIGYMSPQTVRDLVVVLVAKVLVALYIYWSLRCWFGMYTLWHDDLNFLCNLMHWIKLPLHMLCFSRAGSTWTLDKVGEKVMLRRSGRATILSFRIHLLTCMCSCWHRRRSAWLTCGMTVWQRSVRKWLSGPRPCTAALWLPWMYQTLWHGFNTNADLMGHTSSSAD